MTLVSYGTFAIISSSQWLPSYPLLILFTKSQLSLRILFCIAFYLSILLIQYFLLSSSSIPIILTILYLIHILNSFIVLNSFIKFLISFILLFPVSKFPFNYFIFCNSLRSSICHWNFNMPIIVILKFRYVHYLNLLQFVSLTLFPSVMRNCIFVVCSVIFYLFLDSECENYIIFARGKVRLTII